MKKLNVEISYEIIIDNCYFKFSIYENDNSPVSIESLICVFEKIGFPTGNLLFDIDKSNAEKIKKILEQFLENNLED